MNPTTRDAARFSITGFALFLCIGLLLWLASCTVQHCSEGANCEANKTTGPSALPSPAPSASATPTPSPTPSATPLSLCEFLPPSTSTSCVANQPLQLDVRVARAAALIPAPLPTTESSYITALLAAIRSQGACAIQHPTSSDEIIIKLANTYSETYDVWNAAQHPQVLYVQTCTPAKF